MICYCSTKHGGAGRSNTPLAWHLYDCIFCLDYHGIEYDIFLKEYNKYKGRCYLWRSKLYKISDTQIANYVIDNFG